MKTTGKILILLPFIFLLISGCLAQEKTDEHWELERNDLVNSFILPQGISDPAVIEAMRKVPRHLFVPEEIREFAYLNRPLPIGEGQTISQPSLVAYMTELLRLNPDDKVLEIGTGSGYQSAILAELVDSVFTIEIIEPLGNRAKKLLDDLGYDNVFVKIGDGYKGWPEYAPFDAIIVTCAPENIPEPLKDQLKEGGRMVIPVGPQNSVQELYLLRRKKGRIKKEAVLPVRFVPMLDEDGARH